MDPVTITTIALSLGAFLVGHYQLIPFLPKPSATPPPVPTTFGHGEFLNFLGQSLVNALAKANPTVPSPNPTTPPVDLNALLLQLVALIEKQAVPAPVTPVTPVPFVAPK